MSTMCLEYDKFLWGHHVQKLYEQVGAKNSVNVLQKPVSLGAGGFFYLT